MIVCARSFFFVYLLSCRPFLSLPVRVTSLFPDTLRCHQLASRYVIIFLNYTARFSRSDLCATYQNRCRTDVTARKVCCFVFLSLLLFPSFSFSLPLESYYVTVFSHSPPTTSTDFTFCCRFPELHCPWPCFSSAFSLGVSPVLASPERADPAHQDAGSWGEERPVMRSQSWRLAVIPLRPEFLAVWGSLSEAPR